MGIATVWQYLLADFLYAIPLLFAMGAYSCIGMYHVTYRALYPTVLYAESSEKTDAQ